MNLIKTLRILNVETNVRQRHIWKAPVIYFFIDIKFLNKVIYLYIHRNIDED